MVLLVVALVVAAAAVYRALDRSPSGGQAPAEPHDTRPATIKALDKKYDNGKLPADELVVVADGYRLVAAAAEAYEDLESAAADAGITLQLNSAYRTYEDQVAMVEQYGLLADGGRAAEPGTSEHGWGVAVDLTLDYEQLTWFRENAGRYGFAETIAEEPWHWCYIGSS